MHKILTVATSEFSTLVRSKAFIVTLILMPVIMGASMLIVRAAKNATDTNDRKFAYIDRTGRIGAGLEALARERNQMAAAEAIPRFLPEAVDTHGKSDDALRLELSERVRRKELFAFVEIPADVAAPESSSEIRYYSNTPAYGALPQWLRTSISGLVVTGRFRDANVDAALVARLMKPAGLSNLGLFDRAEDGTVKPAEEADPRAVAVPGAMLIMMYIIVMASAPQLLNTVIEEKMSRISEVLIGSVTPFELMMGKLLGCVSVSLLLAAVYIAGAYGVAAYWGMADAITLAAGLWFLLYLTMGVLLFGAIFIAVGAACTDLKDSQSMMMPVMMIIMVPVFAWAIVLRAPDSMTAILLSMLPTASPFLMLVRIGLQPGPPFWQILLSVAIMALTTLAAVWAAGRIFRTGILMQGKGASLTEMIRWVKAG